MRWRGLLSVLGLLVILSWSSQTSQAASVVLAWDASPDPVAGYNVYAVAVGGTNFTKVSVDDQTSVRLDGLEVGKTYLIYVTAVTEIGIESIPGESLIYTLAAPPTAPLGGVLPAPAGDTIPGPPSELPPIIATQPVANTTLHEGESLQLWVAVTGSVPVSYQWIHNGAPVLSATGDRLSIGAATVNDAGTYAVFVVYAAGSILSDVATVSGLPSTPRPPGTSALSLQGTSVLSTFQNQATAPSALTISAPAEAVNSVQFSVESLNPELVSAENVLLGGTGPNRYLVVAPVPDQSGTADIVLIARLADEEVRYEVRVVILPIVASPPSIVGLPQHIQIAAGQRLTLPFFASDSTGENASVILRTEPPDLAVVLSTNATTLTRGLTVAAAPAQAGSFVVTARAQASGGLETVVAVVVEVVIPKLNVAASHGGFVVSWPNLSGLTLLVSSELNGPWTPAPGNRSVAGTELQAMFSTSEQVQFFRLSVP